MKKLTLILFLFMLYLPTVSGVQSPAPSFISISGLLGGGSQHGTLPFKSASHYFRESFAGVTGFSVCWQMQVHKNLAVGVGVESFLAFTAVRDTYFSPYRFDLSLSGGSIFFRIIAGKTGMRYTAFVLDLGGGWLTSLHIGVIHHNVLFQLGWEMSLPSTPIPAMLFTVHTGYLFSLHNNSQEKEDEKIFPGRDRPNIILFGLAGGFTSFNMREIGNGVGMEIGYCHQLNRYLAFGPGIDVFLPVISVMGYYASGINSTRTVLSGIKSSLSRISSTLLLQFIFGDSEKNTPRFLLDIGGGWVAAVKLGIMFNSFFLKLGYRLSFDTVTGSDVHTFTLSWGIMVSKEKRQHPFRFNKKRLAD